MSESLTPLVDPIAPETHTDPRVTAELKKLNLEVDKIELEIKQLRRPPLLHPSTFVPILTSLIALLGGIATVWVTTQWKNQAVVDKTVAEAKTSEVVEAKGNVESDKQREASYAKSLEKALQQANVAPPKTVIIRFRGALHREDITALQQGLIADGFVAPPPIRTTDVPQSGVKYYHVEDQKHADAVVNRATAFFNQQGCPIQLKPEYLPNQENNKPGTIMLDIFQSCSGRED